jgi:hypothetical protein
MCHADELCYSTAQTFDSATSSDADVNWDASPDAAADALTDSLSIPDAGPDSSDSGTDSEIDSGPLPTDCPTGAIYDAPLRVCVLREQSDFCSEGSPLQWLTAADQTRIQGYLTSLGGNGQVGLRRPTGGSWQWLDGTEPPPLTWQTVPGEGLAYAYLTVAGLQALGTLYNFQLCAVDPT